MPPMKPARNDRLRHVIPGVKLAREADDLAGHRHHPHHRGHHAIHAAAHTAAHTASHAAHATAHATSHTAHAAAHAAHATAHATHTTAHATHAAAHATHTTHTTELAGGAAGDKTGGKNNIERTSCLVGDGHEHLAAGNPLRLHRQVTGTEAGKQGNHGGFLGGFRRRGRGGPGSRRVLLVSPNRRNRKSACERR